MLSLSALMLVFCAAALVHGLAGIGFPIITVGILGLFFALPQAIALCLTPTLILNLISLFSGKNIFLLLRHYSLLAITSLVGSYLGVKLLLFLPSAWLELTLAGCILLYIFSTVQSKPLPLSDNWLITASFGLLGGIIGGATNAMSAIIMIYLLARCQDKNEIAQAANLCFALSKLVQIYLLWSTIVALDIKPQQHFILNASSIVAVYIGVWLRKYISFTLFKRLILSILFGIATLLIYKNLTTFI